MSITVILIIANVVASFYAWNNEDIYRKWVMNAYQVNRHGQYFRFLTSGFIHADQMHLLFNMISLWSFGEGLEHFLNSRFGAEGILIYIVFYLIAIIISEIPSFLKHKNNQWYNSLGASGAVSAVIFAVIIIRPVGYTILFMPPFLYGLVFLGYSYYASKKQSDHINHDAHFYGAVFGILFIIMAEPQLIESFTYQIFNWL
jgi:membrane associated rhomboid family serine protease